MEAWLSTRVAQCSRGKVEEREREREREGERERGKRQRNVRGREKEGHQSWLWGREVGF